MLTRLLAVAWLVALVLEQPAQPAPATLRFNWPGDLVARVETERTRERSAGRVRSSSVTLKYRMKVSPHQEGFLVQHERFSTQGPSAEEQHRTAELLEAVVPDMIVSAGGEFRRIENIAPLRNFIETLTAPLLNHPNLTPALKGMLERMRSEEGLTELAGREWQVLVATWRELPLSPDAITARVEEASPFLPGVVVSMDATARMVERGPCVRGGAPRDCATFEMQTVPDQEAMQSAMKRLMSGMKAMESVTYEHLHVTTTARIRLETDTMVPHELTTTRALEMRMRHPVEGVRSGTQTDRRTSRFTYGTE